MAMIENCIFVDTNLLILAFDPTSQKEENIKNAKEIINNYISNNITIIINSLVIFEILRSVKLTNDRNDKVNEIIKKLSDQDYLKILPIKQTDAVLAADLLREINLNKEIKKHYDIEPLALNVLTLLGLSKDIHVDNNMKEDSIITLKSTDKKKIVSNINTIKNINENFVLDVFHFAFCKNNKLEYITDNTKDFDIIDIAYQLLINPLKINGK